MKLLAKYCPIILIISLAGCKKEEPDVIKLDYTSLYESAAYAMVSARENYKIALESNDSAKIAAAKMKMDQAEKTYSETKQNLGSLREPAQKEIKEKVDAKLAAPVASPTGKPAGKPAAPPSENLPAVPKTSPTKAEIRKRKADSLAQVRKANYEAFKAKAASDLQKDTVKNRLNRFNKQVKDFFEGKKK